MAILIIVAYHAGWSGFEGGFVGVDVFFVISGFLISRNLIKESSDTGRVALGAFWGRRIRRLVPALSVMILVVLALSAVILSPLQWQDVSRDAQWSAVYLSNIQFANEASDYFAAGSKESLFLHTWSLGVEEQFYVVWPLMVGAVAWLTRKRRDLQRKLLIGAFAATLVVSFALSVVFTNRGSTHAFFSLPTRAWEFAFAALLALLPLPRALHKRSVATAAGGLGLALITLALVGFDESMRYPGAWPLIPVVGTALVIAAGTARSDGFVSKALAVSPAQLLGRLSYSWYLWHWPIILLAVEAADNDELWVTTAAAAGSLVIGAVSYRLVEKPIRFSPSLRRSMVRTTAFGLTSTLVVLGAGIGLMRYSDVELDRLASASDVAPGVTLAEVRASIKDEYCPAGGGKSYTCTGGDLDSDVVLFMTGDSHTRGWVEVFFKVGEERGVKVIARWRPACPAFPVRTANLYTGVADEDCTEFRDVTTQMIRDVQPAAVVSSTSDDYSVLAESPQAWEGAYREWTLDLQSRGIAVGSVLDTPRLPYNALDCISEKSISECAAPAEPALDYGAMYSDGEAAVRQSLGNVSVLDVNDVICDDEVCHVALNGTYVFTDIDHVYPKFLLTQHDRVEQFFSDLLDR